MQENKHKTDKNFSLNAFWNKHKKGIILVSSIIGIIGITALAVLGINYKSLGKWLKKASLEDLKDGKHIGASALQGRRVYGKMVSRSNTVTLKKKA